MKPALTYELRVLSGEQRGARSAVRPGDTLRLGRDWSNDVVLRDADDDAAQLSLDAQGQLMLSADGGQCQVDGTLLAAGEPAALTLYTPFTVGGIRLAVGRIGAPQWAALFDEGATQRPVAGAGVDTDLPATPAPANAQRAPSRGNWAQRLLAGGAVLMAVSAGALTLAWAMGPASLSPTEQAEHLRQTLAHLGFGALHVESRDGQLLVTGHLDSQAQRSRLEQALAHQTPARVAVWVNEQVTASVGDVYRLNGIAAEVRSGGPGVVHVQTHEADAPALAKVQAAARRDVPGLQQLVAINEPPPPGPRPEAVISDPGKRVAAIVPGEPAYVVTADGTRYFEGAMLPSGHRILSILSDRVQIEREGVPSTLNF
jgi:type III secretion protein D